MILTDSRLIPIELYNAVDKTKLLFLQHAAAINLHSLSYGNYGQESSAENERVLMRHYIAQLV